MGAFDAFLLQLNIDLGEDEPLENTIRDAVLAWMKLKVDSWKGNYYDLYINAFRASHLNYLRKHESHNRIGMLAEIKLKKIWARLEPFGIGFAALNQKALVLPTFLIDNHHD